MIADVLTMVWKEWKELFLRRGSGRSGLLNVAIFLFLLGVFMPLQSGAEWLTNPLLPVIWSWLPVFLALSIVTDAFAGERERHTLETLLASRLSDRAILFGKLAAAVLYAWGIGLAGLLLGAVTINVTQPGSGFQFYNPLFFAATISFSLLAAIFISSLGMIVSLRAATARQAYQQLALVMVVLVLLPTILVQVLPRELTQNVIQQLNQLDVNRVGSVVMIGLVVIDIVLIVIATLRFQRSKLMEVID